MATTSRLEVDLIDSQGHIYRLVTKEKDGTGALETIVFVRKWVEDNGFTIAKNAPVSLPNAPQTTVSNQTDICSVHGVELRWSEYPSKKTGKKYKYHELADGSYCFGK